MPLSKLLSQPSSVNEDGCVEGEKPEVMPFIVNPYSYNDLQELLEACRVSARSDLDGLQLVLQYSLLSDRFLKQEAGMCTSLEPVWKQGRLILFGKGETMNPLEIPMKTDRHADRERESGREMRGGLEVCCLWVWWPTLQ